MTLRGLRAPSGRRTCGAAAFAVAPDQGRALVLASSGPIADVNLKTLAIRYRDSSHLRDTLGQRSRCRCVTRWRAVWPTPATAAVAGAELRERRGRVAQTALGAALIDTGQWRARALDSKAGDVAATDQGALLTFGGAASGLRATGVDASPRWAALPKTRVRSVAIASGRAYVLDDTPSVVHIIDLATGALVASRSLALGRLDVLNGRSDSGDAIASPDG